MAEKKTWIIGKSGSEYDDVETFLVTGTEYQVKRLLASFVKEDALEDDFDYGDIKIADVQHRNQKDSNDGFYAGSVFYDRHNDYTAIPVAEPLELK